MKVSFATNGNDLKDKIALHFGRAKNFLIYDTEKGSFEVFENPEISGKELPPDFLNRLEVDAVITFSLGPMAFEKLKKFGIKMYKAKEGTISENIEFFEKAKLSPLNKEDIF
jgi:ArsR family transcriptional regulator